MGTEVLLGGLLGALLAGAGGYIYMSSRMLTKADHTQLCALTQQSVQKDVKHIKSRIDWIVAFLKNGGEGG